MKTKISDTAKIQLELNKAQGRATARLLTSTDIEALAKYGESRLEALGLPKADRLGAQANYRPPSVANSYKYSADGSYASVTRGSSGWYLTDIHRGQTGSQSYGGSSHRSLTLSTAQQIKLVNMNGLFTDVTALPNSAFANQLRRRLQKEPNLWESLKVTEVPGTKECAIDTGELHGPFFWTPAA